MNDDTRLLISRLNGTSEWEALEEHLNELRGALITKLLTGYASHEEYLRWCGEVKGIDVVLEAPRMPARRPVSSTRQ